MKFIAQLMFVTLGLVAENSAASVSCPPMPSAISTINRDITSEISASVGRLGPAKAAEIAIRTDTEAKNLFAKFPNVDRLLTLQTMASTYCTMLSSAAISDTDRINRWEKFQERVLDLQSPKAVPKSAQKSAGVNKLASPGSSTAPKQNANPQGPKEPAGDFARGERESASYPCVQRLHVLPSSGAYSYRLEVAGSKRLVHFPLDSKRIVSMEIADSMNVKVNASAAEDGGGTFICVLK